MSNPGAHDTAALEALARQYFGAWGDALRQNGSSAPHSDNPGDWKQVLEWWAQLLPERGPGAAQDAVHRFRTQAGGWYGTMQDVAARFAGRDASSADVAAAWREAVMGGGKGDGLLHWMLQGARGSTHEQGGLDDMVALLEQWQQQLAPWLQSPAFGPAREHQARWQSLLRAQQEYQGHSKAYIEQIRQALEEAFALFEQRLGEHEQPGSQLTSARAMFDLWIEVAEEAYAKVALSEPFQQVYASLGNAQMRLRAAIQKEVEQLSERVGLPTRTEMDAAHRRIAELERQLRRLQATVAGLVGAAAEDPWRQAAQPAVPKVTPKVNARRPATRPAAAKKASAPKSPAGSARAGRAAAEKPPAKTAPATKAAAKKTPAAKAAATKPANAPARSRGTRA